LTAFKLAAILYSSEELVEDSSSIDVVQLIIDLFADAIGTEEDRCFIQGDGSTQPLGLDNCTIRTTSVTGNLSFDDIINLIYSLPSQYRRKAKFLVNNANIRELRKLKDGNSHYIWNEAIAPGQPATIYGFPVIEQQWVGEDVIYFGDWKLGYWFSVRKEFSIVVSNVAGEAWSKDQVGIRVTERVGGTCVLEDAMAKLDSIP